MGKLLIFNLKMNAPVLADWKNIGKSKAEVVICPPFLYLHNFSPKANSPLAKNTQKLSAEGGSAIGGKHVKLGAQNCFWQNSGAFTGEISPKMLKNAGAEYVIIGHSERRNLGETDEMISKKISAALKAGLKVILCVGESKKATSDKRQAKNFVKQQLERNLKGLSTSYKLKANSLIIAYEPVWAISTSKNVKSCPPEYALEMIKFIKQILKAKSYKLSAIVLYGGSVDGKNVADFVKYKEMDGVLVGGASLKPDEVKKIIKKVD